MSKTHSFVLYFGLAAESEIGEGDSLDDFGIVEQIEFRNAQHAQYGRRNIDFQTGNASRYMDVDGGGVGELVVVVHGDFVRLVDILSGQSNDGASSGAKTGVSARFRACLRQTVCLPRVRWRPYRSGLP